MDNDIGSHQGRIGQQSGTDTVFIPFVEYFSLHIAFRGVDTVYV